MCPIHWAPLSTFSRSALRARVSLMRMVFCAADTAGAATRPARNNTARNTFMERSFPLRTTAHGMRRPSTRALTPVGLVHAARNRPLEARVLRADRHGRGGTRQVPASRAHRGWLPLVVPPRLPGVIDLPQRHRRPVQYAVS